MPSQVAGKVYGNATTQKFTFAVIDSALSSPSLVAFDHPSAGPVLCRVSSLEFKTSTSNELARRMADSEEFPGDFRYIGIAEVIGFRTETGDLKFPPTPPHPGTDVYYPDEKVIGSIISGDIPEKYRLFLGKLKDLSINVYLDVNSVAQKHISVLAKTGSGKSYVVGVLAEEIIKKGIPLVIIDPHGEYGSLRFPNNSKSDAMKASQFGIDFKGYAGRVTEYSRNPGDSKELKLSSLNPDAEELLCMMSIKREDVAVGSLYRAVRALRESGKNYDIRTIISFMEDDPAAKKVVVELERLIYLDIFSREGLNVTDIVKKDMVTIINLKGHAPEIQSIIVSRLISMLFNERKKENIPSHVIIIEEAHNFAPQGTKVSSLEQIKAVASEGRKFGIGLCIVSQRPARVDKTVLSQCGTQIILKITNSHDLEAISKSTEGFEKSMTDTLQGLSIGEAMLVGGNFEIPVVINVRPRETKHGGTSSDVIGDIDRNEFIKGIKEKTSGAEVLEPDDIICPGKIKAHEPVKDENLVEKILLALENRGKISAKKEVDAIILEEDYNSSTTEKR